MKIYSVGLNTVTAANTHKYNKPAINTPRTNTYNNSDIAFTGFWDRVFGPQIFKDVISLFEKEATEVSGNVRTIYKYFDSNAGRKYVSKLEQDLNGEFIAFTKYKYKPDSPQNQLLSTYNFDKENRLLWETKYLYNADNRISETSNVDLQGNLLHKTKYLYDHNYYGEWLDYTFDFDAAGHEIKKIRYFAPGYKPIPGRFMKGKVQAELLTGENAIQEFLRSHSYANSLIRRFTQKYKELIPEKFEIMNNFDEGGNLKSIYIMYKPDMTKFSPKIPTEFISEQALLFNAQGQIDRVLINHNMTEYYPYDIDPKRIQSKFHKQEIFSPEGILKEVYKHRYFEKYFADGKTIQEIFKPGTAGCSHLGVHNEFYPDGTLKLIQSNSEHYGGSGSTGELYMTEVTFNPEGKSVNHKDGFVGEKGRIIIPRPIETPEFYNENYRYTVRANQLKG